MARAPVSTPVFSLVCCRSISDMAAVRLTYAVDRLRARVCDEIGHHRVLGRHDHVRRAPQRIGSGREHFDDVSDFGRPRIGSRALGTADALALAGLGHLRPVDLIQALEQLVRERGNPDHPLLAADSLDGMVAALTLAVDDLVVREHRAERRTPVDERIRFVGQALFVQAGRRSTASTCSTRGPQC